MISILLYGSETWALPKHLAARINGFDSRSLHRIEGIHWSEHVTNEELRRRTQQPPASSILAQRRVRWYGHVLRLDNNHPTRRILHFQPQEAGWRRPRGALRHSLVGCCHPRPRDVRRRNPAGASPCRRQDGMAEIGATSRLYARSAGDLSQVSQVKRLIVVMK